MVAVRRPAVRKPPLVHAYLMVMIDPRAGRIVDVRILSTPMIRLPRPTTVIHSQGVWASVCGAEGTGRNYDEAYRQVERNLRQPWLAWANRLRRS